MLCELHRPPGEHAFLENPSSVHYRKTAKSKLIVEKVAYGVTNENALFDLVVAVILLPSGTE